MIAAKRFVGKTHSMRGIEQNYVCVWVMRTRKRGGGGGGEEKDRDRQPDRQPETMSTGYHHLF